MMCNYKAVEAPNENNDMLKAIQEYTGTKLNIVWVPNDASEEKVNTLIASTSLPEITSIRETTSAGFINATRAGMFWDLTPYIEQFPNLAKIDKTVMKNVQTDGKQFLIPRTRYTIPGYQGYTGAIAIPKTAVKDEETLLKILTILDKMGDPEMLDLFNWRIKGETYDVADGKVTQSSIQKWKDMGGTKVAAEFSEQYKEFN